jgi:spore coat protein CotH
MSILLQPIFRIMLISVMVFCLTGCDSSSSSSGDDNTSGNATDNTTDQQETAGRLVINEIVAKDANGGPDWIELYVVGDASVSLGNYSITDDSEDREKASLPDITLAPGEFIVIQAVDEAPQDGSYYVPLKLGSDDAVFLYKADAVADSLDWADGAASEGYSYGRLPDGSGEVMTLTPTPGAANQAATDTSETEIVRPEGWGEKTHGDAADPNYEVVFEEGVVHRLDVTIEASDWQAMLDNMTTLYGTFGAGGDGGLGPRPDGGGPPLDGDVQPPAINDNGHAPVLPPDGGGNMLGTDENPLWAPCTVIYRGKQWYHAGVRFKGNSSLSSTWRSGSYKLPFRFDFDEFEDTYPAIRNQRFFGFQQLSLSSGFSDNSLIREKVVGDIFRMAGVPAPRTAFYRLYIDHGNGPTYFGLYTMVEIPAKPMLETQFSGAGGNLYKPEGTGATFASFVEASFDKETNQDEADYADVKALFDALQADREDPESWRAGLEATLNVPAFLRWLAVNTVIQNWDTYGKMSHNYFLYNDPATGLLNWIPWDNNMALSDTQMGGALSLSLTEVGSSWPLIRYLMDDAVYHEMYVADVFATISIAFYPERMQPIYQAAHELIRLYVVGDEGEKEGYTLLKSTEDFDAALEILNSHVEGRYSEAMSFVSDN